VANVTVTQAASLTRLAFIHDGLEGCSFLGAINVAQMTIAASFFRNVRFGGAVSLSNVLAFEPIAISNQTFAAASSFFRRRSAISPSTTACFKISSLISARASTGYISFVTFSYAASCSIGIGHD